MSDLKVRPGQPIRASSINKIVDRLESNSAGFAAAGFVVNRVECLIKNTSGEDRDLGELMVIDDWDGPDGESPYEVGKNIAYLCIDPVWHSQISRLVILAEPIPDGEYGRAVLSGQCLVKITGGDSDDDFIAIDPETPTEGLGTTSGFGRILAVPEEGDHALIVFRDEQPMWRYELTEDVSGGEAEAKLLPLDSNTPIGGTERITIDDFGDYMDDQEAGNRGTCWLVGNKFIPIQARCGS
jgi:hypothetical protein